MTKEDRNTAEDVLDDGLEYEVEFSETEEANDATPVTEKAQGKKRKPKTSKLQEKKRLKMEMDMDKKKKMSQETSTEVIVDYINNKIRSNNPDLSTLELSELYFSRTSVRSTTDFEEPRTLENYEKFINARFKNMLPSTKKSTKKLKKKVEEPATTEERKFIAILSLSALRACDVHRSTKDIAGSSLKLINKNKLEVDLKMVGTTTSRLLCCTPGRLSKVLNIESSGLDKLEIKILILDSTYLDTKMQNIWDLKETTDVLRDLTNAGSKIYLY